MVTLINFDNFTVRLMCLNLVAPHHTIQRYGKRRHLTFKDDISASWTPFTVETKSGSQKCPLDDKRAVLHHI